MPHENMFSGGIEVKHWLKMGYLFQLSAPHFRSSNDDDDDKNLMIQNLLIYKIDGNLQNITMQEFLLEKLVVRV